MDQCHALVKIYKPRLQPAFILILSHFITVQRTLADSPSYSMSSESLYSNILIALIATIFLSFFLCAVYQLLFSPSVEFQVLGSPPSPTFGRPHTSFVFNNVVFNNVKYSTLFSSDTVPLFA
jgi:hypothetical protein